MGLTLKEKQKVTKEIAGRYYKARKTEKKRILDEFTLLTGYNRKYAMCVLNGSIIGKTGRYQNRTFVSISLKPEVRKKRVYVRYYDEAVQTALILLWQTFDYLYTQRLVVFIKENLCTLAADPFFAATDISYFRITNGWLYLCCIKDLYDSSVVSYRCSHNIDAQLTTQTLEHIKCKTISNNTLIHSDQGTQYLSDAFSAELMEQNLIQSLSRRGNCWDNACMESFFGTIKYETGYFDMLKTQNSGYNDMSATRPSHKKR